MRPIIHCDALRRTALVEEIHHCDALHHTRAHKCVLLFAGCYFALLFPLHMFPPITIFASPYSISFSPTTIFASPHQHYFGLSPHHIFPLTIILASPSPISA